MADKKISALVSLAGKDVAATDLFPVVDVNVAEVKSLTRDELRNAVNAIQFAATKALATTAAASLPDDTIIEVAADESLSDARTRYKVAAGALVFSYGVVTKADLADASDPAKGAALVGFTQSGTGTIPGTVDAALNLQNFDIFYGVLGGGADDTIALRKALEDCVNTGKQLVLTKPTYLITGSILPSTSRAGAKTLNIRCQVPSVITVDPAATGFDHALYLSTTAENNVFITGCALTFDGSSKCGSFLRADNNGAYNTGIVDVQAKLIVTNLKKIAVDANTNGGMLFLGPYKRVTLREPEVDTVTRTAAAGDSFGISVSGFTGLVEIYNPRISRVQCGPGTVDADGIKVFGKPINGVTNKRAGSAVIYGGVFTDNQGRQVKLQCSEVTILSPISIRKDVVAINYGTDFDFQCGNGILRDPTFIYKKNTDVSPLGASFAPVTFQQLIEDEEMSALSDGGKMITEVDMIRFCIVTHSAGAKASVTRVKGLRVIPSGGLSTTAFTTGIIDTRADTIEAKSAETTLEVADCTGPLGCSGISYNSASSSTLATKLNLVVRDNTNTLSTPISRPFGESSGTVVRAFKSFMIRNNTGFRSFCPNLDFDIRNLMVGTVFTADLSNCVITNAPPGIGDVGYATFECIDQYFGVTGKGVRAMKGSGTTAGSIYWTQDGGANWGTIGGGKRELDGSVVYDPPSLAAGAVQTTTVTVTGAAVGDIVTGVGFQSSNTDAQWWGIVSAADTVTVMMKNNSAVALDIGSGTLRVRVKKMT